MEVTIAVIELLKKINSIFAPLLDVIKGTIISDEQIKRISKKIIGDYWADFFPATPQETEIKERVGKAQSHITEAGRIISDLQNELTEQSQQLDKLIAEVDEKRKTAEYYANLAENSKKDFDPLKSEIENAFQKLLRAESEKTKAMMETALREQLRAEAERGKRVRQFYSFILNVMNLIIGAALGAYFIPIVEAIRKWFGS